MVDAGILDGDIAVLEKTEVVTNGDIVVALIDNQEATLKRIRKKSNSIALNLQIKTLKLGFLDLKELQSKENL